MAELSNMDAGLANNKQLPSDAEGYIYTDSRSTLLQRLTFYLAIVSAVVLVIILGITSATQATSTLLLSKQATQSAVTSKTVALGLPGYDQLTWDEVLQQAYGQKLNIRMQGIGCCSKYVSWVTGFFATELFNQYGIKLNVSLTKTTAENLDFIQGELAVGNTANGAIDMLWMNGDSGNFPRARAKNLLYGPWAIKVPSAENFDWTAPRIAYDFGTPTNGYSMPFNSANLVLIYRTDIIVSPPQSMSDIVIACTTPGNPLYQKFSYALPPDNTGAGFVRQFLYEFAGPYSDYVGDFDKALYQARVKNAFIQLKRLETGLYQNNGKPYYCSDQANCDQLFGQGSIIMTMSYSASVAGANAASYTSSPFWGPPNIPMINTSGTTQTPAIRAYVPTQGAGGMVSNLNFMQIAANSPHKLAAVVAGNFLGSMEAQFDRRTRESPWGGIVQAYSTNCPNIQTHGWGTVFGYLAKYHNYPQTPNVTYLRNPYALPEINAQYAVQMSADWVDCVKNGKPTSASGAPCS